MLLHHYIISNFDACICIDTIPTRSHLPQHFNSTDLHFYAHDADTRQCDPGYRKAIKANQTTAIQTYNNVTEEALTSLCYQPKDGSCNYQHKHKHTCIVDRTNTELRTVYKHLFVNNSTKRLERYHESKANIIGTILTEHSRYLWWASLAPQQWRLLSLLLYPTSVWSSIWKTGIATARTGLNVLARTFDIESKETLFFWHQMSF